MLNLTPFKDELPIPEIVRPEDDGYTLSLDIAARQKQVELHSELPALTPVWSYECTKGELLQAGRGDTFLGPTVVVNRADTVKVTWKNEIPSDATLPYEVIKANQDDTNPVPQNLPGRWGAIPPEQDTVRKQAHNLHAALVTHLHGGRTQADYDGWAENTIVSNQVVEYTYHNDQAATLLWYHDHAMHITRLNVYAGLAGAWVLRDEEENALNLPQGEYELPLVIQDRNLDVDEAGNFTGALLHKVEVNGGAGPAEFFGPYTLVNGKIWPRVEVEARLYRLRLLNGSNARTYRLIFLDENGTNLNSGVWQIGADQGLLLNKVALPESGLILMPGERADLLIDFSALEGSVYLWNTANVPFGDESIQPPSANEITQELLNLIADPYATADAVTPDNADRRRLFPQVMRFDLVPACIFNDAVVPADPLRSERPKLEVNSNTPIRFMVLVEQPASDSTHPDATSTLEFWEFMAPDNEQAPDGVEIVNFKFIHPASGEAQVKPYWKVATRFYDRINWFIHQGEPEVWYIINLTNDAHPIHVHLVDFQVNDRYRSQWIGNGSDQPSTSSFDPTKDKNDPTKGKLTEVAAADHLSLEANETDAPKDTVRVNPGQMVGITLAFGPYSGRYMYHCHLLEHEDHDMMRPIVVVPKWVPHHDM